MLFFIFLMEQLPINQVNRSASIHQCIFINMQQLFCDQFIDGNFFLLFTCHGCQVALRRLILDGTNMKFSY